MGAKQNLKEYLNAMNISPAQFYRETGLSNGFLNQGDNISSNSVEIIISIYSNLNLSWLITKKGEMLISNNSESKNAKEDAKVNAKVSNKNTPNCYLSPESEERNTCNIAAESEVPYLPKSKRHEEIALSGILDNESPLSIPFYDLPVSAGSLGILDLDTCTTTSPSGYIQMPVFRGCEAIFPIMGISMEPVVHSGDWIGIKSIDNLSRSWDFVQTGVIYLIITREDRMIKYIEKADDSDYIVCSSPNYNPFKVYKGDILNIYRVKAVAKGL